MSDELWLVGYATSEGWVPCGFFWEESDAAEAAEPDEFIALVKIGKLFPDQISDAVKVYFPHRETWEESEVYRSRARLQ